MPGQAYKPASADNFFAGTLQKFWPSASNRRTLTDSQGTLQARTSKMAELDPKEAMTRLQEFAEDEAAQAVDGTDETIEERCFSAALTCLEGHFTQSPPMGPLTTARVNAIISRTLEKTHTLRKVR